MVVFYVGIFYMAECLEGRGFVWFGLRGVRFVGRRVVLEFMIFRKVGSVFYVSKID